MTELAMGAGPMASEDAAALLRNIRCSSGWRTKDKGERRRMKVPEKMSNRTCPASTTHRAGYHSVSPAIRTRVAGLRFVRAARGDEFNFFPHRMPPENAFP